MLRRLIRAVIPDPPAPSRSVSYNTVREVDVDKAEDCREDIDTLLVFDTLRHQAGANPEKIMQLILQVIGRRIGRTLDGPRLTSIPDLRALSKLEWSTITDHIADLLQHGSGPLDSNSPDWAFNAAIILLSPSLFKLSDNALQALLRVSVRSPRTADRRCSDVGHLKWFLTIVRARQFRKRHIPSIMSANMCLHCGMDVYAAVLCQDPTHTHPSLSHFLDSDVHISEDTSAAFSRVLTEDLMDTLTPILLVASSQKDLAKIRGSHEALQIVLQYGDRFGRRDNAARLCRQMLLTGFGARTLLVQFAALHPQYRVSEERRRMLLSLATSQEEYAQTRVRLTWACAQSCNDYDGQNVGSNSGDDEEGGNEGNDDHDGLDGNESKDSIPLDYVRLCAAFLRWMWNGQAAHVLANAVEYYHRTQGWRKLPRCRDHRWNDSRLPTPEELFKEDQALACEMLQEWDTIIELVDALWLFVPKERRKQVLRSIRDTKPDYRPPTRPYRSSRRVRVTWET